MKEIKFRAWTTEGKKMYYDVWFDWLEVFITTGDDETKVLGDRADRGLLQHCPLMQYMGEIGIDEIGIYEGDILEDNFNHWEDGKTAEDTPEFWYDYIEYGLFSATIKIIGNIYENLELIAE